MSDQPVTATASDVLDQLHAADLMRFFPTLYIGPQSVSGAVDLEIIPHLRHDARFLSGILHHLHPEVGGDRVEFRSIRGSFGAGSLQVVIGVDTERFHADIDRFSPYDDVVGFGGHAIVDVLPHWLKRIFGRKA
jgi:hypothetical protein